MRQHHGDVVEHDWRAAGEQVGQGGGTAFVGHVEHVDTRRLLEQFAGQVLARSRARRSIGQLAGVFLQIRHQFGNRVYRQLGIDDEHIGRGCHQADRREILLGVEGLVGVERRVGRVTARREQQRIAISGGLGNHACGDRPARASPVFHNHGPAQPGAQVIGNQARDDVCRAARRKSHDDPHWRFGANRPRHASHGSHPSQQGKYHGASGRFVDVSLHVSSLFDGAGLAVQDTATSALLAEPSSCSSGRT